MLAKNAYSREMETALKKILATVIIVISYTPWMKDIGKYAGNLKHGHV